MNTSQPIEFAGAEVHSPNGSIASKMYEKHYESIHIMAFNSICNTSIDKLIGENIRLRRLMMGLTQDQLADALGLSYQQVQKYETGTNRVSAGRLFQIAALLDTEIVAFYPEAHPATEEDMACDNASARHVIELVRRFSSIENQKVRSSIMSLIRAVTQDDGSSDPAFEA